MIALDDLKGIAQDKRDKIIGVLDDLLTFRDSTGRLSPIISGYNWYNTLTECDRVITFSNIHETEAYRQAMLCDLQALGYDLQHITQCIRTKAGAFVHDLEFVTHDDNGRILQGLRIKDRRTNTYIDLEKYARPLINYPEFKDAKGNLIDEDQGWELDMPFNSKDELLKLVALFLMKSGKFLCDKTGKIITETDEMRNARAPWVDAYKLPVLLLGERALDYERELPLFVPMTKICLRENDNEISFIIHNNLELLRALPHYSQLRTLGFAEEKGLGNAPFIRYVDII